jgi:hypothetical protein
MRVFCFHIKIDFDTDTDLDLDKINGAGGVVSYVGIRVMSHYRHVRTIVTHNNLILS